MRDAGCVAGRDGVCGGTRWGRGRVSGPVFGNRLAWRLQNTLKRDGLSTDFSCFDSALRSIYGGCGRFAEWVGNSGLRLLLQEVQGRAEVAATDEGLGRAAGR